MDLERMLKGLFVTDEDGKTFLNVSKDEPNGELKPAANSRTSQPLNVLFAKCIVLDDNGKPSLRTT